MKIFRLIYVILSVLVVGFVPESGSSFGVSLFVFASGMLYDYISAYYSIKDADKKIRKAIVIFGIVISILAFLFGIMGMIKCFDIEYTKGNDIKYLYIQSVDEKFPFFGFCFPYRGYVKSLFIFVILAMIELVAPCERKASSPVSSEA